MHHDIDAMERMEIIRDLRLGTFHVLVGINLLREGLDLPEVSLVAILDADKEGFLRSETSLIQTIGRAARTPTAWSSCTPTPSPPPCAGLWTRLSGGERSRTPTTRPTASSQDGGQVGAGPAGYHRSGRGGRRRAPGRGEGDDQAAEGRSASPSWEKEMKEAAKMLEFELAAALRDQIIELRGK